MTNKICLFVWILISCIKTLALWESSIPLVGPEQKILIQNTSSENQNLWLVFPGSEAEPAHELSYEVPARQQLEIPLDFPSPWLKIWGQNEHLQIYHSRQSSKWQKLTKETTNQYKFSHFKDSAELWVANLSPQSQKIEVKNFTTNKTYTLETLAGYESKKIALPTKYGIFKISGQYRMTALYNNEIPLPLKSDFRSIKKNLFLLTNSAKNQSFVAEIADPFLAQQAREQIANPQAMQPRMLIARVSPGHNNTNADYLSKLQAPWSWHVSTIHRFADFGSTECNSAPLVLEHYIETWMKFKNGLICFWDYKISKEL